MRILTMLAAFTLALGCGGKPITPAETAGSWTGTWHNATYGSTGAAKNSVTVDETAKTVVFKLDLDGNVFGANDPPEETFSGTFTEAGYTMTGNSATFGALSITVAPDGTLTGSATPTRGNVTLTGSVQAAKITVNYSIADPGGAITGTIELTK